MSEPKPTWQYKAVATDRYEALVEMFQWLALSDNETQAVMSMVEGIVADETKQLRKVAARVLELLPVVRAEGVYNEWATPAAYNEARRLLEDALKGQGVHDDVSR